MWYIQYSSSTHYFDSDNNDYIGTILIELLWCKYFDNGRISIEHFYNQ